MGRRIALINGHPDPDPRHFDHALADAYAEGAAAAGHEVRRVDVGPMRFETVRSQREFEDFSAPPDVAEAQRAIEWAQHLLILYPLWLGGPPGRFKMFLEQALRPGFAFDSAGEGMPKKRLTGRSARIVVTMGMPAFYYRWAWRAHSLKSLKRDALGFCGIGPVRTTLIGGVETIGDAGRSKWLERLRALGARGE